LAGSPRRSTLSAWQQALFSLGTLGAAGPGTVYVQLQVYLTKYLGYDATIIGTVRFLTTSFDAVLDPVMGYLSDRTESRFGRRMPYIAIGAVLYAAGVIGMFYTPAGLSRPGVFAYLTFMHVVYSFGLTMTVIPYNALIPELAKEYRARTTLVSWMQVGTYLGTTFGGSVRAYTTWRGDEVSGFQEFAILSSIVMVVCYWLLVLFVKEPPVSREQRDAMARHRAEHRNVIAAHIKGLFRAIGYAFRNRYFRMLFLAVFTYQAGVLAGLWFYTFLLEDLFGKTWNTPFAQQYMVGPLSPFRDAFFLYITVAVGGGTLMLPFWNWLGKFVEKRICLLLGIVGVGCTYASSYWLFAGQSYPLLILYALLQAFFYCPANIYPISMLADIATHDEWKNGEANEGMFYGANSLLTKLYNAAGLLWFGFAQDHIVGYVNGAVDQPEEVITRMRLLYAFPALGTSLIAVVFLTRYDLSRQKMGEIVAALENTRAMRSQTSTTDGLD